MVLLLSLLLLTSCSSQKDTKRIWHMKSIVRDQMHVDLSQPSRENSVLLLLPLSGSNKSVGRGILNSCLLAELDKNVEYYVIDTDQPLDSFSLQNRFKDKNIKAVIGPVFYHDAQKFGVLFSEIPVLSLSNNIKINNNHIIACGVSPQSEIKRLTRFARSQCASGIIAILPKTLLGDSIASCLKKELSTVNDELEIIRYDEITKEDVIRSINSSNKKIAFIIEPICSVTELESTKIFTLSSIALSDLTAWNGAIFAYSANDQLNYFSSEYERIFSKKPSTLGILGYDIINAVSQAIHNGAPIMSKRFKGCLGDFYISPKYGMNRHLQVLAVENSAITKVEK